MASEDFSRFLEKIPGAYIFLGAQMENSEEQKGLHDPRFNINEEVLPMGAAFLAKVAIDTLNELKENTNPNLDRLARTEVPVSGRTTGHFWKSRFTFVVRVLAWHPSQICLQEFEVKFRENPIFIHSVYVMISP